MKSTIICLVLALSALSSAQTTFTADIKITNDPLIQGLLTGKLYYSASSPSAERIDYTIGPMEVINYDNKLRYLGCGGGSCDVETWTSPQLVFLPQTNDRATGNTIKIGSRFCKQSTRVSNSTRIETVTSLWSDPSGPCKAVTSTGRTFSFSNVAPLSDSSVFNIYQSWSCPVQKCTKQMDVVVAIDTSGSITAANWKQERDFVRAFADSFQFNAVTGVQMGLVLFSYTAKVITPTLMSDKTSFQNVVNYTQRWQSGDTCIGCAIQSSRKLLASTQRPGVDQILVIMTDGGDNWDYEVDFETELNAAKKQSGLTIFSIGVSGDDLDVSNLKMIATDPASTYIEVGDFSQLLSKLSQVVTSTCIDIPSSPCGAGCKGFCSCNSQCICPECNDDEDKCHSGTCKDGYAGSACYYSPVKCQNDNKCQVGTCNPTTGCSYSNSTSCPAGDKCTDSFCQSSVGCITQNTTSTCFNGDVCTEYSCDANKGCQYSNITTCDNSLCKGVMCAQLSACEVSSCDPMTGRCVTTPKDCGVTDPCVISSCNSVTGQCEFSEKDCDDGDFCTEDKCISGRGCMSTAYNATTYCNDNSVCTLDSCNPKTGCVNSYVGCSSKGACVQDTCDPILGCTYPPVDCYKNPNISSLVGGCHVVGCNETVGCYLELLDGAVQDRCGVCYGNGTTCLSPEAIAGISVGAIAGIAIGAAAAVGIVAAVGGKVGYDYFAQGAASAATVNDNPMYNGAGTERANPLYG